MRIAIIFTALFLSATTRAEPIVVASKEFTESVVLGQMAAQLLRDRGVAVRYRPELGGTRVLWSALNKGQIDVYPEYTGTLLHEILAREPIATQGLEVARAALAERGILMTAPLGFDNAYAIGMLESKAARFGIRAISDLRAHPDLRFGYSNEFMSRADGWPGLKATYRLPQQATGLKHDLAYRALASGGLDVIDLYNTDPEIRYYAIRTLEDDLGYFPEYHAMFLYRADLAEKFPEAVAALHALEGRIDEETMRRLNEQAKLDRVPAAQVAAEFLRAEFGLQVKVPAQSVTRSLARNTRDHLVLVGISLGAAIIVSIPLGIYAARRPRPGQVILAATGLLQTIPSLALLVFMIPLLGIGGPPAVMALFLYSLLPIVRNTHAGINNIPRSLIESADALGLSPWARLRLVEIPLALPHILAGIKISAVINVGTATLGALIGAGGYGQPILTGLRLDDIGLILQGAIPAAVLALLVQSLFDLAERWLVPRGLRL
jgi:osmoprotectant transport system permease protein